MATVQTPAADDVIQAFKTFKIAPPLLEFGKTSHSLMRGEALSLGVQVIASGGETNLHAHKGNEAIWAVLNGRARFYTTEDRVVTELGQYECLYIPESVPYWFESASDENLVILRMAANVPGKERGRVDYERRQYQVGSSTDGERRPFKVKEGVFFGDSV